MSQTATVFFWEFLDGHEIRTFETFEGADAHANAELFAESLNPWREAEVEHQ